MTNKDKGKFDDWFDTALNWEPPSVREYDKTLSRLTLSHAKAIQRLRDEYERDLLSVWGHVKAAKIEQNAMKASRTKWLSWISILFIIISLVSHLEI